ncbi:5-nitroimidazole antibiotic resistance protein [Stemphylium lycopersici]|uniref:5-nitroimidazole antibiotic resistance protein n=1 Tax=Stemphylium lycopersici TaxID=183478 RepID=A0A364N1I9_STELY|nr:5-nitroimidazole antibiotic resistance protein [Stemphylium lycopersici]RAR03144.1 5-nitroimidazole antibiotic resistance protein [Stemphylium lycopersici]RAR09141.1 5-nitroimidazole antibiotic resistance protein [Stemphylium lycopersici]
MASEYPKTSVNKLGRLAKRGHYDYPTIHTLLNTAPILHVSFVDPTHPFPVVLPMLGCTGNFSSPDEDAETTAQDIYLHGYISGRMFRQSARSPDQEDEDGLPITVTATLLDGLVLSLTPFHNSCNYRSAIAYGHATLVADHDEALWAMRRITDNMLPGRWEASRVPPTAAETKSTGVLRVRISSGGPSEDRNDLKDKALVEKTWTGVVPYCGQWAEPVAGKQNGCGEVEGYIEAWRVGENERVRGEAVEAAVEVDK